MSLEVKFNSRSRYLPLSLLNSMIQLWIFILTICDYTTSCYILVEEVSCYMWHEVIAGRYANEIISFLFHHLNKSLSSWCQWSCIFSDTWFGGWIITLQLLQCLALISTQKTNISVASHKFMMSHSLLECDFDHKAIERPKKKKTTILIFHPRDWFQLVRST